jgi:protein-S-isoprenylcysteine O-methyltransferase Ste14
LQQSHTDSLGRIGWWLFRRRTLIPIPLALAVLLIPEDLGRGPTAIRAAGVALVALGEGIRLWGVRHIGVVSRTRSDRLGPLVASGPFALVRNPLYLGNIALWAGFAVSARLLWLAPLLVAILALEYHSIVLWEERLLAERLGERYRAYAEQVPRWMPSVFHHRARTREPRSPSSAGPTGVVFSWRDTLHSERGTLIAIAVGYVLLWVKSQV